MEQPQQQPASSVVSQLSDQTGLLKFLGGLVLGLVARSLGSLLLEVRGFATLLGSGGRAVVSRLCAAACLASPAAAAADLSDDHISPVLPPPGTLSGPHRAGSQSPSRASHGCEHGPAQNQQQQQRPSRPSDPERS